MQSPTNSPATAAIELDATDTDPSSNLIGPLMVTILGAMGTWGLFTDGESKILAVSLLLCAIVVAVYQFGERQDRHPNA